MTSRAAGTVLNEDNAMGTPLLQRPEWSYRLGRAMGFPPLGPNLPRVTAVLDRVTTEADVPEWEMAVIQAAERVRELYEGDSRHANRDWAILTDPQRMDDQPSYDLRLLAEAAKVEPDPLLPPPSVPNASNRLTQAGIDAEWNRLSGILWPGMDPGVALQAASVLVAQVVQDALGDDPAVLTEAEAWLGAMAALAAKVAKHRLIPMWVAAWRVAHATETLTDTAGEVEARVDEDDSDPSVAAAQSQLSSPMDLLTVADAGVVALSRAIADPQDLASDAHVVITKPLVEAAFVGRPMTDAECIALMGDDPEAAYGTMEAVIRLACQMGLSAHRPLIVGMALDRWWSAATA